MLRSYKVTISDILISPDISCAKQPITNNKQPKLMPTAFRLENISKVYANGTVALQNLNLTVGEGEFVSLVGTSGCGKSTVLKLIAQLDSLSSGKIIWGKQHQENRNLAFVFQEAALMPWAKVVDNVRLPLKLAGVAQLKSRAMVEKALTLVGLQGCEQRYPRELSGGMKMRVSIARALVTQPRIMLMDEPFGALDDLTRTKLNLDLLALWQEKGWTVVFVTHNISEAVYLSQRVVVMGAHPGRVVAEIGIDAPYPRSEEFRTSVLANKYCREVAAYLREGTKVV